ASAERRGGRRTRAGGDAPYASLYRRLVQRTIGQWSVTVEAAALVRIALRETATRTIGVGLAEDRQVGVATKVRGGIARPDVAGVGPIRIAGLALVDPAVSAEMEQRQRELDRIRFQRVAIVGDTGRDRTNDER